MKRILAGLMLAAACAGEEGPPKVQVCLSYTGVEPQPAFRAKFVAAEIFRRIGVRITWSHCATAKDPDVRILVAANAPAGLPNGVYAYALPYEGQTVKVFYDRLRARNRSYLGDVWGHVMAHEIAHLLQGVARHSEQGVMQAYWDASEREAMSYRPLAFTPYDAQLIHSGIQVRTSKKSARVASSGVRR